MTLGETPSAQGRSAMPDMTSPSCAKKVFRYLFVVVVVVVVVVDRALYKCFIIIMLLLLWWLLLLLLWLLLLIGWLLGTYNIKYIYKFRG